MIVRKLYCFYKNICYYEFLVSKNDITAPNQSIEISNKYINSSQSFFTRIISFLLKVSSNWNMVEEYINICSYTKQNSIHKSLLKCLKSFQEKLNLINLGNIYPFIVPHDSSYVIYITNNYNKEDTFKYPSSYYFESSSNLKE